MACPEFKLHEWASRVKINKKDDLQSVVFVDSPASIVAAEQFRHAAGLKCGNGHDVPVDKFAFAKGEAPTPHCTKVGGLPYRPADLPWPADRKGVPLLFLAQFCFSDSTDYIGALPGDVMLVFGQTDFEPEFPESAQLVVDPYYDDGLLHFEWYKLGERNLANARQLPRPVVEIPTCHGVRFRSCDYLDESLANEMLLPVVPRKMWPENKFRQALMLRGLSCYPGMKIGGKPFLFEPPKVPIAGRFICSFWGVSLSSERPYPWTNQVEALSLDESDDTDNQLLIRDGACLNFYLLDEGSVDFTAYFM